MEEYDLTWVEEPLGAWDPEGYANLRAKTSTRIAYGEREWTLELRGVLATGTVDVVGVDPGRAEGITGFKKVAERVESYRRQANAHAWSSAIVTAASLAISFNSRRASSSSSSRSAIRCSTTSSPSHSSTSRAGLSADRPRSRDRGARGCGRRLSQRKGSFAMK